MRRRILVCALLACALAAPIQSRAGVYSRSCTSAWANVGYCTFEFAGESLFAAGVAATTRTHPEPALMGLPAFTAPYLTIDVVWRHTVAGGQVVDDVLLSCPGTGLGGVPAIACFASTIANLEPGTPLLCHVRGRDRGVFACGSSDRALPSPPSF